MGQNAIELPGETLEAPAFSMGCGGKGANQAVAAAKLGAEVMMLTKVGDDIFGDNTIKNLQAYGIHTDFGRKSCGYIERRGSDFCG